MLHLSPVRVQVDEQPIDARAVLGSLNTAMGHVSAGEIRYRHGLWWREITTENPVSHLFSHESGKERKTGKTGITRITRITRIGTS
jgi:hypothetical protein